MKDGYKDKFDALTLWSRTRTREVLMRALAWLDRPSGSRPRPNPPAAPPTGEHSSSHAHQDWQPRYKPSATTPTGSVPKRTQEASPDLLTPWTNIEQIAALVSD